MSYLLPDGVNLQLKKILKKLKYILLVTQHFLYDQSFCENMPQLDNVSIFKYKYTVHFNCNFIH